MGPDPSGIPAAIAALRRGGLVAYPTETLYGLGALALDPDAVARLYKVKGLPAGRGVSLLFPDFVAAEHFVAPTPLGRRLAAALLPGPVTLVFEADRGVPDALLGKERTVAVRVSPHPTARALSAVGPVTATSANPHGVAAPETAREVRDLLGDAVDVVLDGGRAPGPGSTVVDARGKTPRILRMGVVTRQAVEAAAKG